MTRPITAAILRGMSLACVALLGACASDGRRVSAAILPGTDYVAMGSSFAAGPGVPTSADQATTRCARSTGNYAQILARSLNLRLTDVSCSGATTAHLLGPWNELRPQADALTGDTRLVTITVGGNDVGYIGSLGSASCRSLPSPPVGTPNGRCTNPPVVSEDSWTNLETAMRRIVAEVQRRSPAARIIFVDYLAVLPQSGTCAAVPLTQSQADAGRATARRLAMLTERIARETKTEVFKASDLSRDHSACGREPWVMGYPLAGRAGFIPYHPNAAGMAAVAQGLARQLDR